MSFSDFGADVVVVAALVAGGAVLVWASNMVWPAMVNTPKDNSVVNIRLDVCMMDSPFCYGFPTFNSFRRRLSASEPLPMGANRPCGSELWAFPKVARRG